MQYVEKLDTSVYISHKRLYRKLNMFGIVAFVWNYNFAVLNIKSQNIVSTVLKFWHGVQLFRD